jgi:hypothetical protein
LQLVIGRTQCARDLEISVATAQSPTGQRHWKF